MYSYFTVSNRIVGGPLLVILHIRPGTLESRLEHSQIRLLWVYAAEGATFKIKREKK
jgi:hypothetical protein